MFDITSITSYLAANKQFITYTGSLSLINARTSNEVDYSSLELEVVCSNLGSVVLFPALLAAV